MLEVQTHPMALAIPIFIQIHMPLLLLKLMDQSRHGVTRILEAQTHPMAVAIPRFIQMHLLLLCLHMMAQSRRGATQRVEVQTHPTCAFAPPAFASPQTLIDPSALRAAKAYSLE
jgi:hypothetical protein